MLAGEYTRLDRIMLLADPDFKLFVLQNVVRLSETQKNMGKLQRSKLCRAAGQSSCEPLMLNKLSLFTHYHCIDRAIEEKPIPAIIFVSI